MSLNNDEEQEFNDIIHALDDYHGAMSERERGFVEDQIERYEQYKSEMRLSVKQWDWLRALKKKYAD